MGFKWNNTHTIDLGLLATGQTLPVIPEPKIVTEEISARDGFFDFSNVNNSHRVHYRPRDWIFRCVLEKAPGADLNSHINNIAALFTNYKGWLEVDQCPGVRWDAIITNRFNLSTIASTLREFTIYFQSQAFAYGFSEITGTRHVNDGGLITIYNPGTWHVRPDIYLTGAASGGMIGNMPIVHQGQMTNASIVAPELAPGQNQITITGFTGQLRFVFTPQYIWSAV